MTREEFEKAIGVEVKKPRWQCTFGWHEYKWEKPSEHAMLQRGHCIHCGAAKDRFIL
jgi:hypothetical protein